MEHFFCADHSRQAEEDIIGSAVNHQTYILVECPKPWAPDAFDSKHIPLNLKSLVDEVNRTRLPVRFLLIAPNKDKKTDHTKVLIFDNKKDGLLDGYKTKEFNLESIEKVSEVVRNYLAGKTSDCESEETGKRDILVCTHGNHDKCCARYGNPFYRQAIATVSDLSLSNVRIWEASHFGGHRFAPTMIDFPEGRYYGVLDPESFKSILTRTGNIKCLNRVYRGWGILPKPIQVMERELILRYGWDWFNYKVASRILEQNLDYKAASCQAELTFLKPDGSLYSYRANLVQDEGKTLTLRGSCDTTKKSEFVKYSVENLYLHCENMACLSR